MIDPSRIGRCRFLEGIPASPGIAIGRVFVLDTERPRVDDVAVPPERIEDEVRKFTTALEETRGEIAHLRDGLAEDLGETRARIFDAHLMILDDAMVVDGTLRRIREQRASAAVALTQTIGQVTGAMERTRDEYLRDRVYDIKDIERRLLMRLLGRSAASLSELEEDVLIVAHDLGVTHTAAMRRERVIGFATEAGGRTSHAAIMARSMEIPAVVGLRNATQAVRQGEVAILDGMQGLLVYEYDDAVFDHYRERKRQHEEFERQLLSLKDYPAITRDGRTLELQANIEVPEEVHSAIAHGAAGIGLFRSEYLFLEPGHLPSEEDQFEAYASVAAAVAPSPVVVRTLDVGGDKLAPPGSGEREANPFLGWRGIRYSLSHTDLFMTQLRAILRASARGTVRVMFPMVSSLHEVRDAKQVLAAAREELQVRGEAFDPNMAVGIMVETPAAATIADSLASEVDFMSIGSNDLIQYSLAVDRGNDRVAYLYDQYHPAVLQLIAQTIRSAKRHRKWVGLCGEMAGDPLALLVLLGLGLDQLSTSPVMLPEIKSLVRSTSYAFARKVASRVLRLRTGADVRRYLEGVVKKQFPELSATEMIP
ncbi:MAG: phosphoenolpyruvate--protein phosphotransferase [Candidatus Eisenbacteria bacterium]|nr:phosphoenolpyruvate--protein phosphotransferase [Candidatus Eisenbacteria bacterium]